MLLAQLPGTPRGVTWLDKDSLVVATSNGADGLLRVPAGGGQAAVLTHLATGELGHWWPSALPDGKSVLFTIASPQLSNAQIAVFDLVSGQSSVLVRGGTDAQYDGQGYLLFGTSDGAAAVAFDVSRRLVLGERQQIPDQIAVSVLGAVNVALSHNGTAVYVPMSTATPLREMVFVDRDGHESPVPAPARAYMSPQFSPDGTRVVVSSYDEDQDLWVWDVPKETLTRLSFDRSLDYAPIWTADGRSVVFTSTRTGAGNLYLHAADGGGPDVRLTSNSNTQVASSVLPDGRAILAYENRVTTAFDLIRVPFDQQTPKPIGNVEPLLEKAGRQQNPVVSRDGRFLAYESDESGRFEVYVQPYMNLQEGRWQVSTNGGTQPVWTHSGRELVFLDGENHLTTVTIDTSAATFTHGNPTTLFKTVYSSPELYRSYDISPDGRRFVVLREATAARTAPSLIMIQHLKQELVGETH